MRKLQSTLVSLTLALCAIILVFMLAIPVMADPPQQPSSMFIKAEAADPEFQIRVTWADFLDEDEYQLIANNDSTPGPIFVGPPGNVRLGNGWETINFLPANTTEFVHDTIFSWTYAICGLKGLETSCSDFSDHIAPKFPPENASVDSLQVSHIATDSLRVQWTQSSNTKYSRVEVKRNSNILSTVENDTDQSVTFTGLQPNGSHTITVCVRNERQTAQFETCRSTTARTLPLIPLAPSSVGVVNQSDPNPRQRTISLGYNNRETNAVVGIAVRLIKDNQVVQDHYVYPDSFGERNYQHTFTELEPFTAYEVSVIPYNQSGVGTAARIGFTTPTEVNLSTTPLSGESVMLRWLAPAIGQYTVERKNGTTWTEIYTIRQLRPGETRVVLGRLDSSEEVRVTWKLAYLRTQSVPTVATPLTLGTPELVSLRTQEAFLRNPLRLGTRYSVSFRITVADSATYILQRKRTGDNWMNVASSSGTFADNTLYTLVHETSEPLAEYRVCKRPKNPLQSLRFLCGASHYWSSEGLIRID